MIVDGATNKITNGLTQQLENNLPALIVGGGELNREGLENV